LGRPTPVGGDPLEMAVCQGFVPAKKRHLRAGICGLLQARGGAYTPSGTAKRSGAMIGRFRQCIEIIHIRIVYYVYERRES